MGWEVCTSEQWLAWSGLGDFAGSPLASSDSASTTRGPAPAGCDSPRDPSTPQASSCLHASCSRCCGLLLQPLPTGPSPVCALRFLAPCEVQQHGFSLWRQLSGPRKTWVWEAAAPSWFPCLVCNEWKPGPQAHYEVSKNLCASGLCFLLNQGVFNWCLTFPRQAKIWFFLKVRLNKQTKKKWPKVMQISTEILKGGTSSELTPTSFPCSLRWPSAMVLANKCIFFFSWIPSFTNILFFLMSWQKKCSRNEPICLDIPENTSVHFLA